MQGRRGRLGGLLCPEFSGRAATARKAQPRNRRVFPDATAAPGPYVLNMPAANPARPGPGWHVAECLLPGLTQAAAEVLAERVRAELAGPAGTGIRFLGSLLMPEDEVLLCLFCGPLDEVRAVIERAALPADRVVGCIGLGWPAGPAAGILLPP
jgi:hypothetical protein